MKKLLITSTLLGLLALSSATSIAGPGYGPGHGSGDCLNCEASRWNCDHHRGAIKLSDVQRTRIEALEREEQEKLAPLREEMQKLRDELHQAIENEPIDEERIRQLARDKADKKVDMKLIKREYRLKIEALLSAEQLEQYMERRQQHHEHRGPHGGKKGWRGKGKCSNCVKPTE